MKRSVYLCSAFSLTAILCSPVYAQLDHEPVRSSAAIDFESVFEAALTAAPEAPANTDRRQLADNYIALGERWITNRPSWDLSYIDDGLLDNIGLREMEAGLSVDLWRPGERSKAQSLGTRYQQKADAWERHFAWLVAGRVRTVLADIAQAEALLALEREATLEAERLLTITTGLFESGAVAELDVLQVRSLLLEQREAELQAEAKVVDADRRYTALTNLTIRPDAAYREALSTQEDIEPDHPYLNLLRAEIDLAQANIDRAKREALGSPSLSLGVRRERGMQQLPYNDSFGISFSVPFGGSSTVAARTGAARSSKVDAEINFSRVMQSLDAELHEAKHQLFLLDRTLELASERSELSQRNWEMSRAAFSAGETTLAQVVLALQRARSSSKELQLMRLEQQRIITEYNQVVGEVL